MARPRFRRAPSASKLANEPEVRAKSSVDPNDPALLDEPALLGAPVEPFQDLDPASMHDSPVAGDDPALLDDVGGLESRPDIGGLAEGDDLGIDPDANNPLGVGEPGLELNPDGNFHPADDLLVDLDSGKPAGESLDESSAGGWVDDLIQGAAKNLAGAGNTEQMRQLKLVEDGGGETTATVDHGAALDAVAADDEDGSDTPSSSGMPELTYEELTKLADDIAKVKATLGPDETQDINRHGKTFPVKGAAKTDDTAKAETKPEAGSNEDYVDGDDPLTDRADYQQEYQDMKIDAIRGSEVNPEGTEEYYSDAEMPNFDDISGADDPLGVLEVETPAHLEGMVHDEGVIDPVD